MRIIINADDFGYSHSVNLAIVEAFEKGYVTNTTVMVNMPGFEESVQLAKKYGFFNRVGLHLNFFDGAPLTENIKREKLFIAGGQLTSCTLFRRSSILRRFFLPKRTKTALREEAAAQIHKYAQAGFTQFHLDSHKHAHTIIPVFASIRPLITERGFKTIRKSLNLYLNRSFFTKQHKNFINKRIENSAKTAKYFTSASEFIEVMQSGFIDNDAICEIMVHPVFEDGKLVNARDVDFETLFEFLDKSSLISYLEI